MIYGLGLARVDLWVGKRREGLERCLKKWLISVQCWFWWWCYGCCDFKQMRRMACRGSWSSVGGRGWRKNSLFFFWSAMAGERDFSEKRFRMRWRWMGRGEVAGVAVGGRDERSIYSLRPKKNSIPVFPCLTFNRSSYLKNLWKKLKR